MNVLDNAVPFQPSDDEWVDVELKVPPPRPRIGPGIYVGRSVSSGKFQAFGKSHLELRFDIHRGSEPGVVIARVPMFARLPGPRGLSPSSKLARLFHLLDGGAQPSRGRRFPLSTLRHKLWRVRVADALKNANGQPLPEALRYSVVAEVLERLA